MSASVRCGPCEMGDHANHDGSHHGNPGVIGGHRCDCPGGCQPSPNPFLGLFKDATPTPAPSSTTSAALSGAEQCRCFRFPHDRGDRAAPCRHSLTEAEEALFAIVRPFCADTKEKRDWPRIADEQAVKIVLALAARALVSEPDGLAEQRDYAAFVGAEAELARLRSAIERLHGSPHWCNDNEGQPDVFEEGVLWPCPTIALLAAPDDAEVDRG